MKSKKTKKINFKTLVVVPILLIVGLAFFFGYGKTLAFPEGWGIGLWNNYIFEHDENDPNDPPTAGWLKSNSDMDSSCPADEIYGVHFSSGSPGDSSRYVSGKAWFGIGSQPDTGGTCQNDLPSLGWLDFGAGFPSFCALDDCHAARWHKTGGDNYTGYIDGWARIESMEDNGWVRLKGANYEILSDSNGVLSGFGWNSGTENALIGNSGLGWIKLGGMKVIECDLACVTQQLCRDSQFSSCDASFCSNSEAVCSLGADNVSWTCSNSCGSIPCDSSNISWIDPEFGACGSLDGKAVCGSDGTTSDDELCSDDTTPHDFTRGALEATWTCGDTNCGGSVVSCSARARCGWIETTP